MRRGPSMHAFPHHNPYSQQPDWQHHPHAQNAHHQYAQNQAAAAANAVVAQQQQQQQQQHYGRMNAGQNGSMAERNGGMDGGGLGGGGGGPPGGSAGGAGSLMNADPNGSNLSEENKRVLEWISQVLNPTTREAALLELSKKREQVPELALILWHSFGMCSVLRREARVKKRRHG